MGSINAGSRETGAVVTTPHACTHTSPTLVRTFHLVVLWQNFLNQYLFESEADVNGDGKLNFDEFKIFCNAAKEEKDASKANRFFGLRVIHLSGRFSDRAHSDQYCQ